MQTPRVAIYTRLSKDRSGLSENCEIQIQECRDYAEDQRWEIVFEAMENDISASRFSKKPRPLYSQLISMVKANQVDIILSTEGERLHRRPGEVDTLLDLAEVTDLRRITHTSGEDYDLSTANGIYNVRQSVNAAERESRKISERQKRKKLAQAKQGKPTGGRRPYCFEPDMITVRESEAVVYREMVRLLLIGWSCKSIAYWLNEQGYKTTTGKRFYPITVRNLLMKPRYKGIREHLGVEYPAIWQPIIDAKTFDLVQLAFKARTLDEPVDMNARKYLLTSLLICGRCGNRLTGTIKDDGRGGPKRRIYLCRISGDTQRRQGCGLRRNADALDHFMKEAVIYRLDGPALAALLQDGATNDDDLAKLLDVRRAQQQKLDGLVDDYAVDLLTRPQFARAKQIAEAELQRLDAEISQQTRSTHIGGMVSAGQTVREAMEANGTDWCRTLIQTVAPIITVMPGNSKPLYWVDGNRMRFDPSLIRIDWAV